MKIRYFLFAGMLMMVMMLSFTGCVQERVVNGTLQVQGYAYSDNFKSYKIEVSPDTTPLAWSTVGVVLSDANASAVKEQVLANWNTSQVADGRYILRLNVTDNYGASSIDFIYLTVKNNQTPSSCPAWTCGNLGYGPNYPNISLTQDQYKNDMNCTVQCACPEGSYPVVYSNGDLEEEYDFMYLSGGSEEYPMENSSMPGYSEEYSFTGKWSTKSMHGPVLFNNNSNMLVRFESDYSNSGEEGYTGFSIAQITCSPYCSSYALASQPFEYIAKIRLNNASIISGNSSYVDNSANAITNLNAGENYKLEIDVRRINTEDVSEEVTVWIDYNQDKTFGIVGPPAYPDQVTGNETNNTDVDQQSDDPERIDLGSFIMGKGVHTFTANFTVPYDAVGGITRMRMALRTTTCNLTNESSDCAPAGPCDVNFYGEVEDYSVRLVTDACALKGDYVPCGEITLAEAVNAVNMWRDGKITLHDILKLVNAWGGNK